MVLWLAAATLVLFLTLQSYPSVERALAKNGPWTAYILHALLLGSYAATVISAIVTLLIRLKFRPRSDGTNLSTTNKASAP